MSTQRQVKLGWPAPTCNCGRPPHMYSTDYTLYHIECNHCHIVTPKFHSSDKARKAFRYLINALLEDNREFVEREMKNAKA